jgi:hypothetical protein
LGAGESQSHDSNGTSEASEGAVAVFASDGKDAALMTRNGQPPRSAEGRHHRSASKRAKKRASKSEASMTVNQEAFRESAGPSGMVQPEMFENEEAAASSMALAASLGDDGPSGVVETNTAIGGNSNWSSQESGSLATTFSRSLASVSAAVIGPEPSDEGMASDEVAVQAGPPISNPPLSIWAEMSSRQRKHLRWRQNHSKV